VRRTTILAAVAALAAGCYSWKKEPDVYRIDCNIPNAWVYVYDEDEELLCKQKAGEFFEKFDEKGHVEVKADGYLPFKGQVSELRLDGQKSWYCELRKPKPGDEIVK
jgi:hypothetical protein